MDHRGAKWTGFEGDDSGPGGCSSTDLPDYEDAVDDQEMEVEQGRETPTDNSWSTYTGIWGGTRGGLSTDITGTSLLPYFFQKGKI